MDLKNKTTEKLKAELKGIKMVVGALIVVLSTLFIVCIYGLLAKDNTSTFIALIVVAVALSGIIPLNYGNMKKIKEELELRKN